MAANENKRARLFFLLLLFGFSFFLWVKQKHYAIHLIITTK